MARMVRAISPSSARVSLIFCWNSVAAKPSDAVEDFVTDGAAGGQALVGQRQPCLGDIVGGHHDLAPIAGDAILDVAARELIHNLRCVAKVEVTVEQRHRLGAAAKHHQREHAEHAKRDSAHRSEPCGTQCAQPFQKGFHFVTPAPGTRRASHVPGSFASNPASCR